MTRAAGLVRERRPMREAPLVVAVIGGGANCEHEVSRASARAAAHALAAAGITTVEIVIGRDGSWQVEGRESSLSAAVTCLERCDVVLPLVHGPAGEDGTLAALCDLAGVPFVGSGVRAGAAAMDKAITKAVAASVGVPTAPGRVVRPGEDLDLSWAGPVVVKPVAAGSSYGVTLVEEPDGLAAALAAAWALGGDALVEQCMVGREIGITVYDWDGGPQVTAPLEVVTEGIFDSSRKYDGRAVFRVPAELSQPALSELEAHAVTMYRALGCEGLVRVDFFLTEQGWCLNELNTTPGMTEHSQVPRMFAAHGVSYPQLLSRMVRGVAQPVPTLATAR